MREKIGLNAICQITFEKGAKHILAIDLMRKLEEISTFFKCYSLATLAEILSKGRRGSRLAG